MTKYILKRLALSVPVVAGITLVIFFAIRLLPGDPAIVMAGDLATVISEGETTGTFKGKPIDSVTLETMTLRRGPDGWRIVHVHWSSRAAKK